MNKEIEEANSCDVCGDAASLKVDLPWKKPHFCKQHMPKCICGNNARFGNADHHNNILYYCNADIAQAIMVHQELFIKDK